ncbi:MAG: DUF1801 domain-containing protein [Clostridiaceae bacterium]|nr:DUF1801 domain-containing protein [Clostridiaceae bacterium]
MAYQVKTKASEDSVETFLDRIESPRKREDAYRLLALFTEATGMPAKLWGDSLVGFGSYHYKYKTGHEGDAMIVGFSPRKSKISLYLYADFPERESLLGQLGKHTAGVGCLYVNKFDDICPEVLRELIVRSVAYIRELYPNP